MHKNHSLRYFQQRYQHWQQRIAKSASLNLPTLWKQSRLGIALQIGALIGIWWLAAFISKTAGMAQLGSVLGMFLLWLMLINGWLRLDLIQRGAHWLIKHMLLFFIPAVLVVLDHQELLGWIGLKLFFIIVTGTIIVMACTALSIEWYLRLSRHRQALRRLRHRKLTN